MEGKFSRDATGLLKPDLRFIRITVSVLFLAFALIIGLNSAQSFVEQHRVQTAESFGNLLRAANQIGTSSQRIALLTFASINPPEQQQKSKLIVEGEGELKLIHGSNLLVTNTLQQANTERISQKALSQVKHFQTVTEEFVALSKEVQDEGQIQADRIKTIGVFANKSSELLAESRSVIDAMSSEAVRIARADRELRRDIFLASSAAIILTAAIVLFFIVYRLRLELQKRRQVEGRLTRTNEELENFSSIVAHDLKGPLNNIALSVQMLMRELAVDPASQAKLFGIIIKETDRLRSMIEALLRLSRLGTKKMEIQPFNVRDLIKETESSLKSKLEESNGKVSYHGVPLVWADRALIGNVFQNLIENSIKYKNGQAPEIQINGSLTRDRTIFTYDDNGVGIPVEKRATVFDPFVQANTHSEGVGLGLSVVKKIILAHGGAIQIVDKPDQGTRFEFFIPRKSPV